MLETNACPRCGAPIRSETSDAGDLAGLCSRCLLAAAMEEGEEGGLFVRTAGTGGSPPPPAPEELAAHFPKLEIEGVLGRGGMGVVYRARQRSLDRPVALKLLPDTLAGESGFRERFEREARALARLDHPHIVRVHDAGEAAGHFYLVMELVEGANLRQLLRARDVTPAHALAIVSQMCSALQYAHDQGVLHRDVKPENVLLDTEGNVRIADFGLAKLVEGDEGGPLLTRTRQVMGTPQYMAPEQYERPQEVDHRADIYALGVVFYELLTGDLPMGRFDVPSRKVEVDVRLDEIVLKALEHEPNRRFQHASEVGTEVDVVATTPAPRMAVPTGGGSPPAPEAPAPPTPTPRSPLEAVELASRTAFERAGKAGLRGQFALAAVLTVIGGVVCAGILGALMAALDETNLRLLGVFPVAMVPPPLFAIAGVLVWGAALQLQREGQRAGLFLLVLATLAAELVVFLAMVALPELTLDLVQEVVGDPQREHDVPVVAGLGMLYVAAIAFFRGALRRRFGDDACPPGFERRPGTVVVGALLGTPFAIWLGGMVLMGSMQGYLHGEVRFRWTLPFLALYGVAWMLTAHRRAAGAGAAGAAEADPAATPTIPSPRPPGGRAGDGERVRFAPDSLRATLALLVLGPFLGFVLAGVADGFVVGRSSHAEAVAFWAPVLTLGFVVVARRVAALFRSEGFDAGLAGVVLTGYGAQALGFFVLLAVPEVALDLSYGLFGGVPSHEHQLDRNLVRVVGLVVLVALQLHQLRLHRDHGARVHPEGWCWRPRTVSRTYLLGAMPALWTVVTFAYEAWGPGGYAPEPGLVASYSLPVAIVHGAIWWPTTRMRVPEEAAPVG